MAEAPFANGAWPVPWRPVWGTEDRWLDRLANHSLGSLLALTSRLPEPLLEPLLSAAARFAFVADRRRRRAAHAFLRAALGELERSDLDRRARQSWRHLLRVVVDSGRFQRRVPLERTPEHFDVRMTEDTRRVVAERRGCVLVTGHLGDWEAGMAIAPWIGFHPVHAVTRPPKNRALSRAIQEERERRGIRVLHRKGAMREAPRILKAGGAIALLLDHRTSGRSFLAPFFGRLARCDRSAGVLLQRHRVPVVTCACLLGDEPLTYRVEFPEVLWPEDWAGADLPDIVARLNRALERMILAHPEQYFWLHDRYKDTPEEPVSHPRSAARAPAAPLGSGAPPIRSREP